MKRIVLLLSTALGSMIGGALAFSAAEHVSIGNSLYWALITSSSVGYGDFVPHNTAGKIITSVMLIVALPSLAAVFTTVTAEHIHKKTKSHITTEIAGLEKRIRGEENGRNR